MHFTVSYTPIEKLNNKIRIKSKHMYSLRKDELTSIHNPEQEIYRDRTPQAPTEGSMPITFLSLFPRGHPSEF